MELIRRTHIDFLGKRFICLGISSVLALVAIWSLMGGINRGIDFAGGTEIQVKFTHSVSIDDLRNRLKQAGLENLSLQRIGLETDNEFLVRVGASQSSGTASADTTAQEDEDGQATPASSSDPDISPAGSSDDGVSDDAGASEVDETPLDAATGDAPGRLLSEQERVFSLVRVALDDLMGQSGDRPDLNIASEARLRSVLEQSGVADPAAVAQAISAYRTTHGGLVSSFEELRPLPGVPAEAVTALEQNAQIGAYAIRRVDYVGPRVGKELAEKAFLAMFFALAGMMIYITLRFRKLGFALGAILALVHDGIISAGIFNLWGGQFDLTIVAGLLTLLGYSVNDTIVIFDRVRENMRAMRGRTLTEIFNESINQTLSRTLLTSLTTLLVVASLFFFGGATLHGFAFLLLFGIAIGTYSTIFVASPVVIAYLQWTDRKKAVARAGGGPRKSTPRQSRRASANR